jgi:hypothetical protein
VAAECRRHKRFFNAVVFATDFQVEGEVGTAQIGKKLALTPDESHPILIAGTQTRAIALAQEVSRALHEFRTPRDKADQMDIPIDWDMALKVAVMRHKFLIANEMISSRFGISYQEFLKTGKAVFPEDVHRETMTEISRTSLDCWLLILAFSHTTPTIYRISSSGSVEVCENFAAIGSGYYIAEASLFQRSQSTENDLGMTIYNVYEAMKLGSIAPGVGDKFQIGVAEWDWYEQPNPLNHGEVKVSFLEPKYYTYLAKRFARFGPRPVSAVPVKPRFIKERYRAVVETPKGEYERQKKDRAKKKKMAKNPDLEEKSPG